jgi:hypothetical protein
LDNRDLIVALATRYRLPEMYSTRPFIASGGLMSYDTDIPELWRHAADYADRILRGDFRFAPRFPCLGCEWLGFDDARQGDGTL